MVFYHQLVQALVTYQSVQAGITYQLVQDLITYQLVQTAAEKAERLLPTTTGRLRRPRDGHSLPSLRD